VVLLQGCSAPPLILNPGQARNSQELPKWVRQPPNNYVSACARVDNGDYISAKKIATAKAQADYLTRQSVTVVSNTDVIERVNSSKYSDTKDSSYQQHIHLQTQGEVTSYFRVIEDGLVHFDQYDQWCVLMGVAKD
jgi:hypothetical protein